MNIEERKPTTEEMLRLMDRCDTQWPWQDRILGAIRRLILRQPAVDALVEAVEELMDAMDDGHMSLAFSNALNALKDSCDAYKENL